MKTIKHEWIEEMERIKYTIEVVLTKTRSLMQKRLPGKETTDKELNEYRELRSIYDTLKGAV